MIIKIRNEDKKTIKSFGEEWTHFDQKGMGSKETLKIFNDYFSIFSWKKLPKNAKGFDLGCGSGRWAKFVAPKVRLLNCIDPSDSIDIAKKNLKKFTNIIFHKKSLDEVNLKKNSQDFGYSLGVLHHIPNTEKAIKSCVEFLKPGAPFLIYIYYYFENRPAWFKLLWILSNFIRLIISKLPKIFKFIICDFIAFFIYYPLAKLGKFFERTGFNFSNFPLYSYRNYSLYTMRTDALDRFGTPLEKRFTKNEIYLMMKSSKLEKIKFKNIVPFWTVIGFKKK